MTFSIFARVMNFSFSGESLVSRPSDDARASAPEHREIKSQPDLVAQLENVLRAPADKIDVLLGDELEKALAACQNKEWAEMMLGHDQGFDERDFISDVKGDDDYSF